MLLKLEKGVSLLRSLISARNTSTSYRKAWKRDFSCTRRYRILKYSSCKPTSNRFDIKMCLNTIRSNHEASTSIQPFILPDIGEGIQEVVIKSWNIRVGDYVKEFDSICEVESDKATANISSRYSGIVTRIHYKIGDSAKVGQPLVDIQIEASSCSLVEQDQQANGSDKLVTAGANSPIRSEEVDPIHTLQTLPSVRRLAKEAGIDLREVIATGKQGRILKEDVLNYISRDKKLQREVMNCSNLNEDPGDKLKEVRVPFNGIKKAMFKTMTESNKIPHFNYSEEYDLTKLMRANRKLNENSEKIGTFTYIIKMVSLALLEYPMLNASVDVDQNHLLKKNYHNIGIAIDTEAGLVVPNIKNVETLTIAQINSELTRLRDLGNKSGLGVSDLNGGTCTLSNIGAIGGVFGVPVLVSPEILIGALGRARKLPRFNSVGSVEERIVMQVVWSADHRVVDGATLSRFSNLLKVFTEEPESALLRLA